jgi:coniferyl-aldehyde dehydrogenase
MTTGLPLNEVKAPLLTLLEQQKAAFNTEGAVAYETRIDRLDRCIALLVDHQTEICEAVNKDFGCRSRHVTLMTDIFTSVATLKNSKKHLKKWMKPEKRKPPVPLNLFGAKTVIKYQPKGVVGIMTPWNVPINMIFSPLADIIAAGNRAMIKPSEFTPETARVMKSLFAKYFEETEVAFVTGGPEVGAAFSGLPFDHLIFTGATSIGKLVMKAAAENLTPVTLELGGKSPVVVSDSMPISDAAEKLIGGKSMNSGQLCISPDYAFIPASRLEAFITSCKETISAQFPTLLHNPDFVALINQRHFDRIKAYIDDAREKGARIVELNPSKENWQDPINNPTGKIPLHLIIDPTEDMLCMQDEIFGPILNVKSYRKVDDCIKYINSKPHPLALYYFGKNTDEQEHILDNTQSGGACVNDIAMHFASDDIPFGGVGPSGMGNYHGHEGFKTFSHAKSVFKQGFVNIAKLAGTLPPYSDKVDKMMAQQIKK